jgi:hypothetical protein
MYIQKIAKTDTDSQGSFPNPDSPFLRLPGEPREQIYDDLFISTRVSFGQRGIERTGSRNLKPAPHALAVLRVCRRIHGEAKSLWLSRILFNFEDVESLLDKFSTLPLDTLSQIRHVRTRGHTLPLRPPGYPGYRTPLEYRLVEVLKLLPGLRLDILTVLGRNQGTMNYDTLGGLIEFGGGWRELRYITRDFTMLGFKSGPPMTPPFWRRPQPTDWNKNLLKCDRTDPPSTVTIYRSTQPNVYCTLMNGGTREIVGQKIIRPSDLGTFGGEEDPQFMRQGEKEKELLVVVKRSGGIDTLQRDTPINEFYIREWARKMTWQDIKMMAFDGQEDGHFGYEIEEDDVVEVDEYNNVDDYVWESWNDAAQ